MIDPKLALAYSKCCGAKLDLGHNKGAINDCDKALTINPKLANAYNNLGIAKAKLGEEQEACAD